MSIVDRHNMIELIERQDYACVLECDERFPLFAGIACFHQGWYGRALTYFEKVISLHGEESLEATLWIARTRTSQRAEREPCMTECQTVLQHPAGVVDRSVLVLAQRFMVQARAIDPCGADDHVDRLVADLIRLHEEAHLNSGPQDELLILCDLLYFAVHHYPVPNEELANRVIEDLLRLQGILGEERIARKTILSKAKLRSRTIVNEADVRECFSLAGKELEAAGAILGRANSSLACANELAQRTIFAIDEYRAALRGFEQRHDAAKMLQIRLEMAQHLVECGNLQVARDEYEHTLALTEEMVNPAGKYVALLGIHRILSFSGRPADAIPIEEQIYTLPCSRRLRAAGLISSAQNWGQAKLFTEACKTLHKALALLDADDNLRSDAYTLLATYQEDCDGIDVAMKTWRQGARFDRALGLAESRVQKIQAYALTAVTTSRNVSNADQKRRWRRRSEMAMRRADAIIAKLGVPNALQVHQLEAVGQCLLVDDDETGAIDAFEQAITILPTNATPLQRLILESKLGLLYHRHWQKHHNLHELDCSERHLVEALRLADAHGLAEHAFRLRYVSAQGWYSRGERSTSSTRDSCWEKVDQRLEEMLNQLIHGLAGGPWQGEPSTGTSRDTHRRFLIDVAMAGWRSDIVDFAVKHYLIAKHAGWQQRAYDWLQAGKAPEIAMSGNEHNQAYSVRGHLAATKATLDELGTRGTKAVLFDFFLEHRRVSTYIVRSDGSAPVVAEQTFDTQELAAMASYHLATDEPFDVRDFFKNGTMRSLACLRALQDLISAHTHEGELILISPDKALYAVPWGALNVGDCPLLKRNAIALLPAARLLPSLTGALNAERKVEDRLSRPVVVLGSTDFIASAEDEARQIAAMLGTTPLCSGLNKAAFLQALSDATLVHFCGHGHYDPDDPMKCGLCLVDGVVTTADLLTLPRMPNCIVLSGCNTGRLARDPRSRASPLTGVVHALLAVGCASVVASQWRVYDASTHRLMHGFYDALCHRRQDLSQALQSAAVGMMADERWCSPYYWSAFTTFGDWR
ncbi:MAG: CHAT domain-containing protein [Phycisphaerales bacterium]|nr:CHAT domain-containing protein [Phycisphaerales bacterium]